MIYSVVTRRIIGKEVAVRKCTNLEETRTEVEIMSNYIYGPLQILSCREYFGVDFLEELDIMKKLYPEPDFDTFLVAKLEPYE